MATPRLSLGLYTSAILAVIAAGLLLPRLDLAAPHRVVGILVSVLAFASLLVLIGLLCERRQLR